MEDMHEQMIAAYQPSEQVRVLLSETPTVLMVGMSGVGRDTIINQLVANGEYYPLVTSTTRLPRINNGVMEQDGVEYHFLPFEEAQRHLESGDYVEVSPVHGHINGLLIGELQRAHDIGKIAITDMDPQGARKYRALAEDVVVIFVLPPSYDEWIQRNRLRYADEATFLEAWPRRRESAIMELTMATEDPFYHFVVNDDLQEAVAACHAIVHNHSGRIGAEKEGLRLANSLLTRLTSE